MVPYEERETTIADLFRSAGCEVEFQKVERKANNVICTLAGAKEDLIVVGGHYDFVSQGNGVIDDWSGTSMLVSLYEALKSQPRQRTYKFVAFAKEEVGLLGSRKFVHSLSKAQKQTLRGFVNLECLGTSPMKLWMSRSTPELVQKLDRLAGTLHVTIKIMNADRVGDDDTHPFVDAKLPVISLHSLDQETLGLIHNKRDNLAAIQMPLYFESYRLIAFYLAYLDSSLR